MKMKMYCSSGPSWGGSLDRAGTSRPTRYTLAFTHKRKSILSLWLFFHSKCRTVQGPVDQPVSLLFSLSQYILPFSDKMHVSDWLKKFNTQYNAQSGKFLSLTCKWVGEPGYVQPYKDKSIDPLES